MDSMTLVTLQACIHDSCEHQACMIIVSGMHDCEQCVHIRHDSPCGKQHLREIATLDWVRTLRTGKRILTSVFGS
jgi:hypothetical protein